MDKGVEELRKNTSVEEVLDRILNTIQAEKEEVLNFANDFRKEIEKIDENLRPDFPERIFISGEIVDFVKIHNESETSLYPTVLYLFGKIDPMLEKLQGTFAELGDEKKEELLEKLREEIDKELGTEYFKIDFPERYEELVEEVKEFIQEEYKTFGRTACLINSKTEIIGEENNPDLIDAFIVRVSSGFYVGKMFILPKSAIQEEPENSKVLLLGSLKKFLSRDPEHAQNANYRDY